MKIFKIKHEGETDTVLAETEDKCIEHFMQETGVAKADIESITEVPESEWDDNYVHYKEDSIKPFKQSFREEVHLETESRIIASTAYN